MAEGGLLPWKVQKIDTHRGPMTSYKGIMKALPPPPKDMKWIHDEENKEWRLEKVVEIEPLSQEQKHPEEFIKHFIQPTDTFQGICLKYKMNPTELRRANRFNGSNLALAPNPLTIPRIGVTDTSLPAKKPLSKEEKIIRVLNRIPILSRSEARCYLELSDWNLQQALQDAKRDNK
eukprot:CAMPEP_0194145694 /NCGR_PEP_ID=MMETSP0152-20130528/18410_1 /TAXON_ID=1049557 /ORGANISM="Thalassiothrix antarctica, Strain L6-D1" /LENGTH=175 /DNA_ID=CAMNT_0038845997 /DNA_START=10 /DNA_END=537 /DNA_ORIENTATION=+